MRSWRRNTNHQSKYLNVRVHTTHPLYLGFGEFKVLVLTQASDIFNRTSAQNNYSYVFFEHIVLLSTVSQLIISIEKILFDL